jgi:threonine dehydrogenase-like Zn-dependent dehydrogenase
MKAARYKFIDDVGYLKVEEVPQPSAKKNEVRVKVAFSGICGSDIARYRQLPNPPKSMLKQLGLVAPILGHEFSGVIDQVGDEVPDKWEDGSRVVGSRVVVHPIVGCDHCQSCLAGYWSACEKQEKVQLIGLQRNGAMAEWVTVPFNHVIRITNDALSLDTAALSEPLAVSMRIVEAIGASEKDSPAAVLGDGTIGILTAHLLKYQGFSDVLFVGRYNNRLKAAAAMGVEQTRLSKEVDESYYGKYKYVVQLAGTQEALEMGMHMLRPGGMMVCLGYLHAHDQGVTPDLFFQIIRQEKTLKGSHSYSYDQFKKALQLISDGEVDVGPISGSIISIDEIVERGFEPLISQEKPTGKILVGFS